ncbi:MAG: macro domain-containing protein [Firmicutes bacterium]|nr:macro domain-containing protein [Bacillota bacterium]
MSNICERIAIYHGDITRMGVDAIVNAANPGLIGGSGVDGAIHLAAGPELQQYCRGLGGCAVGKAKLSPAFRLPCEAIIHTVGPIWVDGRHGEAELLRSCYVESLQLAAAHGHYTVAIPAISTGAYGYPAGEAAEIAFAAVCEMLRELPQLRKVYLVAFDNTTHDIYQLLYRQLTESAQ